MVQFSEFLKDKVDCHLCEACIENLKSKLDSLNSEFDSIFQRPINELQSELNLRKEEVYWNKEALQAMASSMMRHEEDNRALLEEVNHY